MTKWSITRMDVNYKFFDQAKNSRAKEFYHSLIYDNEHQLRKEYGEVVPESENISLQYQQIAEYFHKCNETLLLDSLDRYSICFDLYQIPINESFFDNEIPNILMTLAFGQHDYSIVLTKKAVEIIAHYSEYPDDSYIQIFYKLDILSAIINVFNSLCFPYISHCFDIILNYCWVCDQFCLKFYEFFPISSLIDLIWHNKMSEDVPFELRKKIRDKAMKTLYTLSFMTDESNSSSFFDLLCYCIDINEFINLIHYLWILKNICESPQILDKVYNSQKFVDILNKSLISEQLVRILPTIEIINNLLENNYDCSSKFHMMTIMNLLNNDDPKIVQHAVFFIRKNIEKCFLSGDFRMLDYMANFNSAYFSENSGFYTQLEIAKCLIFLTLNQDSNNLRNMIKKGVVKMLMPFLSSDDNEIVKGVLKAFVTIWRQKPVIDENNHNDVAKSEFLTENGNLALEQLDYSNKDIYDLTQVFIELYEESENLQEQEMEKLGI
ncbi:hypothetical protein TRFO_02897 [Tritrichomonas foetus]|uniref:Uncharacterized protein n=1 Tax=Tritrichomonas foetus TaxID=1144522 RepID=A0A1J4KXE2_9EUKA|nr:hypothetical protein TRFO_02897 [Tritrichomonas foetus]|eukprot:OHT15552.1 hypothetical protein TRFO_02897 [Tritrichomonas foetus]